MENFLKHIDTFPLLGDGILKNDCVALDLSVNNPDLKLVNVSSSVELEKFIWEYMALKKAKVAYGGYIEERDIYKRSTHFNTKVTNNERNIHLGLDLWIEANWPIFAPLSGTIHSFKNNTNYGDYGPTLILEHCLGEFVFYTLYGHLSLSSLNTKSVGQKVVAGQCIAHLGAAEVNGNYPPHLHFQVIKHMGDYVGDYPGVCSKNDLNMFLNNSINPALFFY